MKVILSIKPEYTKKILEGTKKFEFRKSNFAVPNVKTVLIYATKPIGKVVGEFEINGIHVGTPTKIWALTKHSSGISKRFFDEYYRDRGTAVAICIGRVSAYAEPLALGHFGAGISAPQSYKYVAKGANCSDLPLPFA